MIGTPGTMSLVICSKCDGYAIVAGTPSQVLQPQCPVCKAWMTKYVEYKAVTVGSSDFKKKERVEESPRDAGFSFTRSIKL